MRFVFAVDKKFETTTSVFRGRRVESLEAVILVRAAASSMTQAPSFPVKKKFRAILFEVEQGPALGWFLQDVTTYVAMAVRVFSPDLSFLELTGQASTVSLLPP